MHKKIITLILIAFLPQIAIPASLDYDQFREEKIFKGKPVEPNLVIHKEARKYRTVLEQQSTKGPNFAGHYTIVTIGCGTSCAGIAVVDAQTGDVYFPENLHHVFWSGWWQKPYGPEFKLMSRLLTVRGQVNSEDAPNGISSFEWTGKEFILLHFEARDSDKPPK